MSILLKCEKHPLVSSPIYVCRSIYYIIFHAALNHQPSIPRLQSFTWSSLLLSIIVICILWMQHSQWFPSEHEVHFEVSFFSFKMLELHMQATLFDTLTKAAAIFSKFIFLSSFFHLTLFNSCVFKVNNNYSLYCRIAIFTHKIFNDSIHF